MSTFPLFPALPTELRLEIWRAHFTSVHGTRMHIFHAPPSSGVSGGGSGSGSGPQYICQDAATGAAPAHDTLAAARASPEARGVLESLFAVGDTRCLQPQNDLLDSAGRLIDHGDLPPLPPSGSGSGGGGSGGGGGGGDGEGEQSLSSGGSLRALYAAAARDELRRRAREFALGPDDVVYVVDGGTTRLLAALGAAPWFARVRRLGVQVLNFAAAGARAGAGAVPSVLDRLGRWARWDVLLSSPPAGLRRLLEGPGLERLLLVVVPDLSGAARLAWNPRPNVYGFVVADPDSFVLGTPEQQRAVRSHVRLVYSRLCKAFPNLDADAKVGCVADVVPARAKFSIYP
ncbi:hypothetical protein SAMD00023353_0102990 [Rosellinia necatrix]|uniref:2EXR domain-containing protein n=1 Tax=Rosellinia necatrix TaxID=77044 RepID=A0A1S7UK80_ROSNE|nr:hypothetical protein SAMD00023353_0102990 [Rosellinia necatrix]